MRRILTNDSRARFKKVVLVTIALAIWSVVLWRVVKVFNPSTMFGAFSSDCAIPVLMSNDDRPVTLFNAYYYGAGRWGGWPFLFAQLVRRATGYRWTDQRLFLVQAIWVFTGAIVMTGMTTGARLPVGLICLLTICLNGVVAHRLFDLGQVYAWQITALLLAWYCLRRFFTKKEIPLLRHAGWAFLTLWFSFLAIWSSFASTPILFFLLGLEGLRAYLISKKERAGKVRLRKYLWATGLVGGAAFAELLMRWDYYRHNLKHYGADYQTQVTFDVGYLTQNLERQLQNLVKYPWWPYYLLGLLFLFACAFAYSSAGKRNRSLAKVRETFVDDSAILIIGSVGIAVINFVLIVIADHVRLNLYDDRFMTPTYLFGSVAGLLAIFLILRLNKNLLSFGKYFEAAFIVTGLLLLTFEFPPQTYSPFYKTFKETAAALEERAPRAVLMGTYWQTYVFSALESDNALVPVPLEGHHVRTPWTPEALRQATSVIVEYHDSNFGTADSLPQNLSQYGNSLRLVEPRWYENHQYSFALYVKGNR